jgi:hypothetical protein
MLKEKRSPGRPRNRLKDNIKMDLREMGCDGMDWTNMTQDRDPWKALVNMMMKFWFHKIGKGACGSVVG